MVSAINLHIYEDSIYQLLHGPLDKIIIHKLIPTIFGCPISHIHRELMSLPLKNGGLVMPQLKNLAKKEHAASLLVTRGLVNDMKINISCYNLL